MVDEQTSKDVSYLDKGNPFCRLMLGVMRREGHFLVQVVRENVIFCFVCSVRKLLGAMLYK